MELTLDVPESIHLDARDIKMQLAVNLYERGILDSGYAARAAGVSRREFIETMPKYGVSIFDIDDDELQSDINNAKRFSRYGKDTHHS